MQARLDDIATDGIDPAHGARLDHEVRVRISARRFRERDTLPLREDLQWHSAHAPCWCAPAHALSQSGAGPHRDVGKRRAKRELHYATARAGDGIAQEHRRTPRRDAGAGELAVVTGEALQRIVAKPRGLLVGRRET